MAFLHQQAHHHLSAGSCALPSTASTRCLAPLLQHQHQQLQIVASRRVVCLAERRSGGSYLVTTAEPPVDEASAAGSAKGDALRRSLGDLAGLGDTLGPIGLTIGGDVKPPAPTQQQQHHKAALVSGGGVELGPIGMTFGGDTSTSQSLAEEQQQGQGDAPQASSIATMSTAEWRAKYERDGMVDLWVEEEFNAGSRLVGGRAVHLGGVSGFRTGEGITAGDVPVHKVKIYNHYQNNVVDVEVPEDRYILFAAEDEGLQLPYACRMGCCTACAVKIIEGDMYQPEALGISAELKEQGYALMCVGFPSSDLVMETVPEDEIYEKQFGSVFATQALDPNNQQHIERDDFGMELANMDE